MEHGATVASLVGFQQSIGQIVAAKDVPNLGLLHILKKNSKYATSMIVDHTVSILIQFLKDLYLTKSQRTKFTIILNVLGQINLQYNTTQQYFFTKCLMFVKVNLKTTL
jgi:hypothetical protein